ncbi:MAG: hypothetical protein KAW19_08225 [Candidatus Aminicenantes bacterium]|nr:hypothetical protein [Candidatus Aminicenantes bacterium]
MKKKSPSMAEAVKQALAEANGPIKQNDLIEKILEIYPSSAKNPDASIRSHLRMEEAGQSIVYLDKETITPFRVGALGVRFRISLLRYQVNKGVLPVLPAFLGWTSYTDESQAFKLIDEQGNLLPTDIVSIKYRISGLKENFDVMAFKLSNWFQKHNARRNDSILVTIESWEPRCFRLEFEPEKKCRIHREEIEYKNQELADILFDMLETATYEEIYIKEAIPTAYLCLSDPRGYPGDHWTTVLEKESRMRQSDYSITYPERRNFMERILTEGEPPFDEQDFTPEQEEKLYQFRISLKYRKDIWRQIEIQGNQTLADFDSFIRSEFGHDMSDHLGGFWKLVRRGQTNRYRKIDFGNVDPLGEGSGAEIRIAGLGLQIGDRLKYVYDFGDWIEHEIILEKIESCLG